MSGLFLFNWCAAAVLIGAAIGDLRLRIIHNQTILVLIGLWVAFATAQLWNGTTTVGHIAFDGMAAGAVFVFCFICFTRGWFGGGDAKLMPVGALWVGYGGVVHYVLLLAILGGVLSGIYLLIALGRQYRAKRARVSPADRRLSSRQGAPAHAVPGGTWRQLSESIKVPYGVAIAASAIWGVLT